MFKTNVEKVLNEVKDMLVKKNLSYGNSALEPIRVFSKVSAVEGLKVRIDDKLSRIAKGQTLREDDVKDLIGYLVLLKIKESNKDGSVIRIKNDDINISKEHIEKIIQSLDIHEGMDTYEEIESELSELQK